MENLTLLDYCISSQSTYRLQGAVMHHQQEQEVQQCASPAIAEAEAMRLAALESADPTLTPILASIVSEFVRSEPLPTE